MNLNVLRCRDVEVPKLTADEIETFERPHTRGTNGNYLAQLALDMFNCAFGHGNDLGVHGVLVGVGGLDRQESARTHMKRHFVVSMPLLRKSFNTLSVKCRPAVGAATEPLMRE